MALDRVQRSGLFRAVVDQPAWQPPLDIYELRDGWLIKVDLAGIRPEDCTVSVAGRQVSIRGFRRDFCIDEGCSYYRMEISYSRFERCVELPCDPGPVALQTDYRDGMLLIRIRRGSIR